jgi:large subunit ribosomal protein L10
MAISRKRKEELVALYGELLQKSDAIFLAEYGGMSVKTMEELRIEVDKVDGAFHVTKNTLLHHILEESQIDVPAGVLQGQIATGFALKEAPALAKTLVDFASKQEHMKIKGGFLGTRYLTAADVEMLAKLPSLDQLRAQLLGLISAPAQNVVGAVAGGVRQIVNVLDAYAKNESSSSEAAEAAS